MYRVRSIRLVLLFVCVAALLPLRTAPACAAAGDSCGSNVRWTLSGDGTLTVSGTGPMYNFFSGELAEEPIPSVWGHAPVLRIVIGEGVTTVGDGAFIACRQLKSVRLPESLTAIGALAFACCDALEGIEIPAGVKRIGKGAFRDCEQLTAVTVPPGVVSVGGSAFYGCTALTQAAIGCGEDPAGTSLGDNAFAYCRRLTSLTLGRGVTSVGAYAFLGCAGLTDVYVPDSVASFGDSVFMYCIALERLRLPFVGSGDPKTFPFGGGKLGYLFEGRWVGADVPCEGQFAFRAEEIGMDCYFLIPASLKTVSVGGSVCEGAFQGLSGIETVILEDGAEEIGAKAFADCPGLRMLSIPESVTSIGENAFGGSTAPEEIRFGGTCRRWAALCSANNADPLPADVSVVFLRLVGDIDGDGDITVDDARMTLRACVGLEPELPAELTDFDGDGEITIVDARLVLRVSVGLEDPDVYQTA